LAELQGELQRLRLAAGQPSLRLIAQNIGWSRATVGRVFSGESPPKWDTLDAVVGYLGGSAETFRQLWIACMDRTVQSPPASIAPAAEESVRQRFSPYVAAMCLALLFTIVLVQDLAPTNAVRNQAITDAGQLVFGIFAAGLWCAVFCKTKEPRALALTFGFVAWSVGQACWLTMRDISGDPIPDASSIAHLLYLLLPACVIAEFVTALSPKWRWRCAGTLGALW
jgi:transcriptional regulator with XRE-family HTH domain